MSGIIGDNTGRGTGLIKAAGAGGTWTKLSHTSIGSAAYVEFEPFSATYEDFKIVFVKFHPATNSQELRMRFNISGSVHTGSDYMCGVMGRSSNANTYYDDFNNAAQFHLYTDNQPGNEADESGSLEVIITAVHNTTFFKHAYWIGVFSTDTSNDIQPIMGGGNIQSTSAVTGCRFYFNSGNIQGGEATLYGRKIT